MIILFFFFNFGFYVIYYNFLFFIVSFDSICLHVFLLVCNFFWYYRIFFFQL